MNNTDVVCPHCGEIQSDCTNGGDPGHWWHMDYIPEGECKDTCQVCKGPFIVVCEWSPSFTARKIEDEE